MSLPKQEKLAQHLIDAGYRREALKNAGCSTYILNAETILCLCCGLASYNSNDMERRYCSFCRDWHSEWIDR